MSGPGTFEVTASDPASAARCGRLTTAHGVVETPVFMPVGTQATVKAMSPDELVAVGSEIILSNTYHLMIRPGLDVLDAVGGLHAFMGWNRPILTDSGGFQVFSLSNLRKIRPDGVEFSSHVDGRRIFLGPVEAMAAQRRIGSDIAMAFDECVHYPCEHHYACEAVDRTLTWAALCAGQERAPGQLVFGIVQGGEFAELRARCARELRAIGFDGYAIGGVSVGEPGDVLLGGIESGAAHLPADRPRYLMGVGKPWQMIEAVARGVDMFDCVMPTRCGRNGSAYAGAGRYAVKAGGYKEDLRPIEEGCSCYACRNFSRAYVRHLLNVDEILGVRLVTIHNLHYFMGLMRKMREAIRAGCFEELRREYRERGAE